ncbi:NAD(P)/FAD-dependent oxidoreductase [Myxococcota bacterium]|nr:NAD(P)/FAD-dependent oxidoreductase [Myxococcota bacterium]
MKHYDVAVIGAGFSGLAAAVRLAYFGKKVVVLERHSVWGGLNSFYKRGGHHFDTGLHAVTNYLKPGYRGPRIPMQRLCRQLRISPDELGLEPQTFSEVVHAGHRLRFTNDLAVLTEEVRRSFPASIDDFVRLSAACERYPDFATETPRQSGRAFLAEYLRDPVLIDLLMLPISFYGSAEEDDIDREQLVILFNSIFREGFSRPRRGVRQLLDLLLARLETNGAELRRRAGVNRIVVEDGRVKRLELEDGDAIGADVVISSAGLVETMRLRDDLPPETHAASIGALGFVESLWVLDRSPASLGHEACVTFFNLGETLAWRAPSEPVDFRSGVVCCPSNYAHAEPIEEQHVRATHLARPSFWMSAPEDEYVAEKARTVERSRSVVGGVMGADFSPHVTFTDAFTPRTVKYYTGKENGAIYGSPDKRKTGRTDVANLFLCGTDQGLAGIVGSMLSGITIANAHGLGAAGGDA